ncbi:adenylyl-sulfate kinase [Sungkyunkwania multivorans]|uniref:Adenylyl-sulfate kinase n=1 Tax=Sungkyunkwania multivorans TaxID=1173618 RepID=A0ABW3D0J4_9FLAO
MSINTYKHTFKVDRKERNALNKHNSMLLWFTGLSGSGKSTIANKVEQELHALGIRTYTLDGDNVRKGMNKDLSFSPEDRSENIRRIGEMSKLFIDAGIVVLASFVSPYKKDREMVKATVKDANFIEVYVNTSVEECERRDIKGLYKKAREGKIKNLTGISAPYEAPENPDIEIVTERETIDQATRKVIAFIEPRLGLQK